MLTEQEKQIITHAFIQKRMTYTPIDLQNTFLEVYTLNSVEFKNKSCRIAFENSANFAKAVRSLGDYIPIIWVMYCACETRPRNNIDLESEQKVYKQVSSMFREQIRFDNNWYKSFTACFKEYLESLNKDTLIISGVNANACVKASIIDGKIKGMNIIVLMDAINFSFYNDHAAPLSEAEKYQYVREAYGDDVIITTTDELTELLKSIDESLAQDIESIQPSQRQHGRDVIGGHLAGTQALKAG